MRLLERYNKYLRSVIDPSMFADIVAVECTPSAKWFLSENKQEEWKYRSDFPCILPPGSVTWMEYEMPVEHAHNVRAVAALILLLETPEEDRALVLPADALIPTYNHFLRQSHTNHGIQVAIDGRPENLKKAIDQGLEPRWLMFWQLFAEPPNIRELVPYISYAMYIDQNGQMIDQLQLANVTLGEKAQIEEKYLNNAFADLLPYFFCLSLTHCRNVELVERTVPPAVVKKRKEKGIPYIKFKQLVIKPVGGKRMVGGSSESQKHNMMPLSFIRGHFKTFSEERPLFGKWSGRYWWSMSARGDSAQGEIVKTYKVKPQGSQNVQERI